jgi:hypothetical protein
MQPWDRQPGESVRVFKYFQAFLSDPEANLSRVAKSLSLSRQRAVEIASTWRWRDRRDHYEGYLQTIADGEIRKRAGEAIDGHLTLVRSVLYVAGKALERHKTILESAEAAGEPPPFKSVVDAIVDASREERALLAAVEARVAGQGAPKVDASVLSSLVASVGEVINDELAEHPEARRRIAERMARLVPAGPGPVDQAGA